MLIDLNPGDRLSRREVHARYGGRQQGGVSPSKAVPAVMFFTDPESGQRHGYYDGWDDDGYFNYVGEGQIGDQRLVQGNKSIANHVAEGRTLEGFRAKGSEVTYLGEFEMVDHYLSEAHESGGHALRQVIVFRLRALNDVPVDLPRVPVTRSSLPRHTFVPIEEHHTERAFVTPDREPYEMERREAALVNRYAEFLRRQGHEVSRLRVVPAGEVAPLYSDLWDITTSELVEAKGLATREQLRMAVGQLHDYGRFVDAKTRAVLLPSKPRPDLLAFLAATGVDAVWQDGDDWDRSAAR